MGDAHWAMLDSLLGRAALKERIEELQTENEHLRRRLDAESERKADAVSARQSAEERANRLDDRIAELEDRVERAGEADSELRFRGVEALGGARRDEVLARLDSVETGPEGAFTAVVDDGAALPPAVRDAFGDRSALVARAAPCLAVVDDAGVVSAALRPPLPPEPFAEWGERFRVDASWFRPVGRLAFCLVRSDVFALGVYEDGERVSVETVASDVKSKHGKGGFSQSRFERRRDAQIREHLDECEDVVAAADPERLVVVGEETVLDEFAPTDRAERVATVDATGDPTEALDDAFRSFWTTRLYRF